MIIINFNNFNSFEFIKISRFIQTSEEQLLGSLTSMSSPAVRTSARVIQKMKMDSIRPTTPPPVDKEEHHRNAQKTPNQHRPSKTIWSNTERNLFFDAINEYGKDFESIANYINGKQKRKNTTDPTYKAKEHVRLLYYQTFTKISKYLRFSEGELIIKMIQFQLLFFRLRILHILTINSFFRCGKKSARIIRDHQLW